MLFTINIECDSFEAIAPIYLMFPYAMAIAAAVKAF